MTKTATNLGTEKIGKLLVKLAIPAIIAQLVNVLYNIVDRIFIGKMADGEIAMAGVGVAFPIIMLISAFSALVGAGGAPLAAIKMGENDMEGANKIMSNAIVILISLSLILTTGFMVFKEPILYAFGASDVTIAYGLDYLNIYLIGTIAVQISLGMNLFIITQGFAKTAMFTVTLGAGLNIALDPIFIFGFNMGVKGAALATIISQFASATWILVFIFGKKSKLKIRKKYLKVDCKIFVSIISLGVSPFIMQATECLVVVVMNTNLLKYGGDLAISMMTIMSSIMQIIFLPCFGIAHGAQPITSYNYGAKDYDRVRKAINLQFIISFTYAFLLSSALALFPEVFVHIFNSDPSLIEMGSWCIPLYFRGMFIFGAQIACQQAFLALGKSKISLILALLRKVVLLVPLAYIIPLFYDNNPDKLTGLFTAEPVADALAAITTFTCFVIFYKNNLMKSTKI